MLDKIDFLLYIITMRSFRILRKNKKGFTLIELIVVIAIMAILAGVIVPVTTAQSRKADRDQYKQYVSSVMETAEDICNAYNNGAKRISGYDIVNTKNEIQWSAVQDLLNTENVNNYKFNVTYCTKDISSLGLNEGNDSLTSPYTSKDTVVVYFKTNGKGEYFAVGCWYFEQNNKKAKYKYDYVNDSFISGNEKFYTPS